MIKRLTILSIILLFLFSANAQVRNGWRSIYDKKGRLTRMLFYANGQKVADSSMLYQYHTDNVVKALIKGEIIRGTNDLDGSITFFDYSGAVSSFVSKIKGNTVFNSNCNYEGECLANWTDEFNTLSQYWKGENHMVADGHLILNSVGMLNYALYEPGIPLDLTEPYACKVRLPATNCAKVGVALNWKDEDNFLLLEISFGKFYSIFKRVNGVFEPILEGRNEIEKITTEQIEVVFRNNGQDLIFEINGIIEHVLPSKDLVNGQIALVSRARGDAYFEDFLLSAEISNDNLFYTKNWIGKGTGLFVAPNIVLTTYDVIVDAHNLRVKMKKDGKVITVPAEVYRLEEESNLALLRVDDKSISVFDELPFGFADRRPLSDAAVFSVGFPHAITGIYLKPETYEGNISSSIESFSGYRNLKMPFRYGMIGAPVFDNNLNFVGLCAYKGLDLSQVEMIDFYENQGLFKANMGKMDRNYSSPLLDLPKEEQRKKLSELVVLIESSIF